MPLLRTPSFIAAVLLLTPVVAQAAPVSKKPPPAPLSSQGSQAPAAKPAPAKPAGKAAPAGLHNASHGSTAKLASAAAPQRAMPSKSIGSPTDGHLVNGVHLADAPYLRIYPVYTGSDVRWGTDTLVGLVDRAAKSVRKQFPDAVLSVGQLSKNGGGEVDRHASHESGRDADVGFYVKSSLGKPILADHMVAFLGDGTAPSWPGAHFDDARNWALVSSIVGDPHAKVTHLFVATPIRERLLAYAAKIGASPAIRSKAAEVLAQPHGSLPHDDHFHVRIACPAGQDGKCIEQPLAHHGHGAALASHGHPAHPSHGASSSSGATATASITPPAASPAHAAPASGHAAPAAPPKAAARSEARDESAKGEASIPSLAPSIPGLDSAVIPAPLTGVKSTWGVEKDLPPPARADAANVISDPDGVLEHN